MPLGILKVLAPHEQHRSRCYLAGRQVIAVIANAEVLAFRIVVSNSFGMQCVSANVNSIRSFRPLQPAGIEASFVPGAKELQWAFCLICKNKIDDGFACFLALAQQRDLSPQVFCEMQKLRAAETYIGPDNACLYDAFAEGLPQQLDMFSFVAIEHHA
ncbi:hypothetical protein ASC85_07795 [Pseudomonas sp. Root401]|nr:hypothetical protein ASC85_07795 [Pseudomonas sp. Root401]